jgi:hypothetical protein
VHGGRFAPARLACRVGSLAQAGRTYVTYENAHTRPGTAQELPCCRIPAAAAAAGNIDAPQKTRCLRGTGEPLELDVSCYTSENTPCFNHFLLAKGQTHTKEHGCRFFKGELWGPSQELQPP